MPSEYEGEAFKRALFGPTLVPTVYAGQSNGVRKIGEQVDLQDALESMGEQLLATQSMLRATRKQLYDVSVLFHDEMHHHRSFAFCQEKACQAYHDAQHKIEETL